MTMQQSTDMMKVMPITMLFVIPIYAWVWYFLNVGGAYFDTDVIVMMPWCAIDLNGFMFGSFPVWIFIYTMISLPIGQIENKLIRLYLLKKELKRLEIEVQRAEIE